MRLDTSMSQRMSQQQVLAPRMIQSMEILQLPIMALQERIQQELQENPVLELKEATDEPVAEVDFNADDSPPADAQRHGRGGRPQARRDAEHGVAAAVAARVPQRPARLPRHDAGTEQAD